MAEGVGDVTREEAHTTVLALLRDYGFATVVALACLYVGRQDIILPMVSAHQEFLREIAETQREIGKAVSEQTRLLYALQRDKGDAPTAIVRGE